MILAVELLRRCLLLRRWFVFLLVYSLTNPSFVTADDIFDPQIDPEDRNISLPYAFWNENFGTAFGYVYGVNSFLQPQARLLGTVIGGSTGSAMGFLSGQNFIPFASDRLFLDPMIRVGYFDQAVAYVDGNPSFTDERAGSNNSDPQNYLTGSGSEVALQLRLKYLLNIGDGAVQPMSMNPIIRGLPSDASPCCTDLNPLSSGRTFLEFRPFYRAQNVEVGGLDVEQKANGAEFQLFWDNRDYLPSPMQGNALALKYVRDWGLLDSSEPWSSVGLEYDHYVNLGASDSFRQRVLAFDFWISYSPSWEEKADGTIENAPPAFSGATLGGLFRLRAYPEQRFSDKTAIYYGAELRLIPEANPFDNVRWLQERLGVEWIQPVVFVELGRVAPHWDLDKLHSDMKWDLGVGFRLWVKGLVVRLDVAESSEGIGVQMMLGQPFQF